MCSRRGDSSKSPGQPARGSAFRTSAIRLLELQRGAEPDDVAVGGEVVDHAVRVAVALEVIELVLPVEAADPVDQVALGPHVLEAGADIRTVVKSERIAATRVEHAGKVEVR